MQTEMGYERFVHFENHVSGTDPFSIPETEARADWYGVGGIPHVVIDGVLVVIGAGSCSGAAANYRTKINQRLSDTSGLSPVSIASEMAVTPTELSMSATYRLVDPVSLSDLRATLLLYEDNVYWCCGYGGEDTWQHTTRAIYDENVVLAALGDEVTVATTIPIPPDWNPDELHAVAYIQQASGTKDMIQAQKIGYAAPPDYSLYFFDRVRSVPLGNGTALFAASITNLSAGSDTFTLEPGAAFGSWTTDFLVCGDGTPHGGPHEIVLDPDETCAILVRVHTDGTRAARNGSFLVRSQASGREHETVLRVFNGSYSVFVVDDDGNHADEAAITDALDALGTLHDDWHVYQQGQTSPTYNNFAGYDYLIWHHSWWAQPYPLTDADMAAIMRFMDDGGSLFLTSQLFLNYATAGPFTSDYLGLSGWSLDRGYELLNGVAGDPIGDGLSLPLSFPYPSFAKGDDAAPGPNAQVGLTAPDGSRVLLRSEMPGGAKSIFLAVAFNAISAGDPDPNNTRVLLGRILDWLRPWDPAAIDPAVDSAARARIDRLSPNPFASSTTIGFSLDPEQARKAVALAVYDIAGRRVARLLEGTLPAGRHEVVWDGRRDDGTRAGSGVYFARMTSGGQTAIRKVLRLP